MATIQKRGDTYRIRVSAGYDAQGKQVVRSMTWRPSPGMTERQKEKELERQTVLFEEKVHSGQYAASDMKFQDFAEMWFKDFAQTHYRARTYREYEKLAQRVYPAIGHIRIDRLQPRHLLAFYKLLSAPGANQRTGGGLSQKSILHYHTFISAVMERAVKWQMIPQNPCRQIDPPKPKKAMMPYLDDVQTAAFLEALDNEPIQDRVFFTLAIYTGMRRGELLGLEWSDIDFDTGVISVRRTSQYDGQLGTYTDTTKTELSRRSMKVSQGIVDMLREYRAAQAEKKLSLGDRWDSEWIKHPRLFTGQDGKPMPVSVPLHRLKKILQRAGLPEVSLHSLRHTNATLLIQQGVSVRTVSARLGHSQTSTTMNIYAEQLQSADAAAAEALDIAIKQKKRA